ncbi:MAG: hypothetical protein IJ789_04490, partial [Bacteroidales bacterium]|nr:hypothetical protein [Bacteroidales bacterium]
MNNIAKRSITLVAALLLTLSAAVAQISLETTNEKCKQKGTAKVVMPSNLESEVTVKWTYSKGWFSRNQQATGLSISGLEGGTSGKVVVTLNECNKKLFERSFSIEKEDCVLDVSISASTESVPCDGTPSARLVASASGGTPPYKYSWGSNTMTVSSSGTYSVTVTDDEGVKGTGKIKIDLKKQECSQDPNEIAGPDGYGDSTRFVAASEKMRYTISFENDPDFATAPASRVYVTYPVPPSQNISSFRLADFGFGSFIFSVPSGVSAYSQRLDVSDSLGVWVDVTAGIDIVNNQLFWIFQSIDPETGFEPTNSQMGFLLVNDALSRGEGYVSFTIQPKANVATGDTVGAEATIIFDDNASIATNVWRNTFDAVAPTSHLLHEMDAQDSLYCTFSFAATDDEGGAGVSQVQLFVSENEGPYQLAGLYHPDSAAALTLDYGKFYKFVSQAVDNVGNVEPFKPTPDVVVNNNTAPTEILLSDTLFAENAPVGTVVATLSTVDNDVDLPFVYSLVEGFGDNDNALFQVVGNELRTAASFACTGRYEFLVRLRTTDITGLSFEDFFEITATQQNFPQFDTISRQICFGQTYTFNDTNYATAGLFSATFQNVLGCDSTVTLNLTVNPVYSLAEEASNCQGSDYSWLGHENIDVPTAVGVYALVDSLTTAAGCDSVVTLNFTVLATSESEVAETACDSYTWALTGETYTESGLYLDTLVNAAGCDSVVTLNLTINRSTVGDTAAVACDSYTWYDAVYTESATPTHTLTNAAGCDSVVTLNLTVNHSTAAEVAETACDSYTWALT